MALVAALGVVSLGGGPLVGRKSRDQPPTSLASAEEPSTGDAAADEASHTTTHDQPPAVTDASFSAHEVCSARLRRYQGQDNPFNVSLAASFSQEAAEVAAEDERVHGSGFRSTFRDRAAGEVAALCYFDADAFGIAPPQPGVGIPPGVHTRLQEVVRADGTPYVLRAGQKAGIPVRALEGEVR